MRIFENSIVSIELGIEDYENNDPKRISSAIRNIYAGVLLLLKHVLEQHSPEGTNGVLIYKEIIPVKNEDGSISIAHKGFKTVNREQMQQRFNSLGLEVDWKRLEKISKIRNEIEHFYSDDNETLIREALYNVMPLIHNIIIKHLDFSPTDVFSDKCWNALKDNEEVYGKQLEQCRKTLQLVDWDSRILEQAMEHFRCSKCKSALLQQTNQNNKIFDEVHLECIDCGDSFSALDILEDAIREATFAESFVALKDGGEVAVTACPSCYLETYSYEDKRCLAVCGLNAYDLKCRFCDEFFPPEDFNFFEGMCGNCSWRLQKAEKE